MPAPTGAHTELWYYWEEDGSGNIDFDVGDSTSDSTKKAFGGDASLSQFEGSNNAVDIFEPNSRRLSKLVSQQFDGSFTVDFEMSNPWWLQGLISEPTQTGSGPDYTYTYDGDEPWPMAIYAGYGTRAGGDEYRLLEGSVIVNATIEVNVEGLVEVSLTGAYANENKLSESLRGQPSLDFSIQNFADAFVDLDGSTLSLVQDASLEVQNNTDMIFGLGDRIAQDYSPKGLVPSIDYTKIRQDSNEVEDLYGTSAATSVQQNVDQNKTVNFQTDNGEAAGDGIEQTNFIMDGSFPDSLSVENLGDPQEDLQQSINRRMSGIKVEATNETSTHP